jgi:Ran GTPase-activating protein (RanGAP) involved in mRNA processing and transport
MLESLNISSNRIESFYISEDEPFWTQLLSLDISDNSINPEGARGIANAGWTKLRILNISQNKLGDQGAGNIAKGAWPQLRSLNISRNKMGDQGFARIITQSGWEHLQSFICSYNKCWR